MQHSFTVVGFGRPPVDMVHQTLGLFFCTSVESVFSSSQSLFFGGFGNFLFGLLEIGVSFYVPVVWRSRKGFRSEDPVGLGINEL